MNNDNDEFAAQWRRLEHMARRGFDRLTGMGNERGEGFGANFRMGRMLAAGDIRLVALYFIEQQPRHGYDLIKMIEDRSQGFYAPSPGMIYPALTYLEEAGYVTSENDGNKKLYAITDAGRAHLGENRQAIEATLGFLAKAGERMAQFREWSFGGKDGEQGGDHRHERGGPFARHGRSGPGWGFGGPGGKGSPGRDRNIEDVLPEVNDARRALKQAIKDAVRKSEDIQRQVAEILRRAADEIARAGADDIDL